MVWNIILTSFAAMVAIMVVAQLLYMAFARRDHGDSGDES